MNNKLTKKEFISVSLMLFAMFFGSGNLIFPPILGNQAADAMWPSLLGFAVTAVIFPILGILAVAKTKGVENLGKRVGPVFAIVYPAIIFLSIGPGIAIPRNGSLAFEMSVLPYLSNNASLVAWRLGYTFLFFALAYFLSLTPSKLVDRMGKILTPVLLVLILLFFFGSVAKLPVDIAPRNEAYARPVIKGFLEGYNTMDALASLNFGFVIALTIRRYQVNDDKEVIKYASRSGLIAGFILFIVYAMLAYVGEISSQANLNAANGGNILFNVTNQVFGSFGAVVLILIFTLACLTTVVGLITSVSEYFTELFKEKLSYKAWTTIFTLVSFVLSNFGLNAILQFSVPILVAIYPVAIVLILMALLQDVFNFNNLTYRATVYVTFFISILQGLGAAKISVPLLTALAGKLPFASDGMEWVIPAVVVAVVFNLVSKNGKNSVEVA